MAEVEPASVIWQVAADGQDNLFASADDALPPPVSPPFTVARAFVERAEAVICHSDPGRFDLLYRMLCACATNRNS